MGRGGEHWDLPRSGVGFPVSERAVEGRGSGREQDRVWIGYGLGVDWVWIGGVWVVVGDGVGWPGGGFEGDVGGKCVVKSYTFS